MFWEFQCMVPISASDEAAGWVHTKSGTSVLSAVIAAKLPRSGRVGPQWHVSVVDRKSATAASRPSDGQMSLARCAFDLLAAEEDNHHPGRARHLFLPVDPSERVECECKTDEVVVTDFDGYQWTNPADGECRGCELEKAMTTIGQSYPCPIHTKSASA